MKTESELYDEFYKWLDDNMGSIKVPTFFVELLGFEMPASVSIVTGKQIGRAHV